MKKTFSLLLTFLICALLVGSAHADQLDDVQSQINQKNSEYVNAQTSLANIKKSLASLSGSLSGTQAQLDQANAKVAEVRSQLESVQKSIDERQKTLDYLTKIRNKQIRQMYTHPSLTGLELVFSSKSLSNLGEISKYQDKVITDSVGLIKLVNTEIDAFKKNEAEVSKAKEELEAIASQISNQLAAIKSSYYAASSKQSSLNNQIKQISSALSNLNSQQRELIAAKYGITSSPIGSVPPTGDPHSQKDFDPGFRPAFAVFSFGAYTHRNGMSQYGAYGRALSGQNAEQILAAYYHGTSLNKAYPLSTNITVNGTNEYGQTFNNEVWNFEEYVKHLYEVPSSWPMEVLKAQAVAARSYAVSYTNNGSKAICPSQACQVVKREINATAWQQAVEATRGWVMTGGSGFQYSSTSGGYLNTSGWDTTCGGIGCWLNGGAYEAIGGSPWFYKGWYKDLNGVACGRNSPWLTQVEFADLLNSWVVYTRGNASDKSRVISIDYGSCWGGSANPYSMDEMRNRASQLGGAFTTISTASVTYNQGGYTDLVKFVSNLGYTEIAAGQFEDIANLRLPGKLAVKTALFNIESRF